MSTVQLGAENFERTITENEIVFVDFWAVLVRPVPPVRARSTRRPPSAHPDIVFGKVDTEAERALAAPPRSPRSRP